MNIFACKEPEWESRVVLTPATAARFVKLGLKVQVEAGIGASLFHSDDEYRAAGATVAADSEAALQSADVVLRLNPPTPYFIRSLRKGSLLVSFLDPFLKPELVSALAETGVDSLCMELVPRTTYAQKMDALSSQASLAGYAATILAADRIDKVLPMMSTPAGTIQPARVFIVGVGVAGLQAIATAKRLGARVSAYDTRPVVEEQVKSLGARFVKLDVQAGETEQGYARELTEEQLTQQRQQMVKICAESDIVITTAQVFGRPAPRIITAEMVAAMRPGSVIVDLAASSGGNVEGTQPGKETTVNGVRIVGLTSFPSLVARDASQMYSSNVYNLMEHALNRETLTLNLDDKDDEVVRSTLLTRGGEVLHEGIRGILEAKE